MLKEWADWADSIELRLAETEALIREGREFFKEDNLALLASMTWAGSTGATLRELKWDYASGTAKKSGARRG